MASLAETASGFKTVAECEKALGGPESLAGKSPAERGSLFNRTAGNISRCEIIDGEPLMVVIPKPLAEQDR